MFEYDERYSYQDMSDYFTNLSKQNLIKKSTYSTLYHPMMMLAKKYAIISEDGTEQVKLEADHIILLCYLMGYIREASGFQSYFGSNATLSKDLGTTVRSVQRRLKDLCKVGFIVSVIDNYSERHIYINYERIFAEITKIVMPDDFNSKANIDLCRKVVDDFIFNNFLEKTKLKEYTLFLRVKGLTELAKNKKLNLLEFLYQTLAAELKMSFEFVRSIYEKARLAYIKDINTNSNDKENQTYD